MKATQASRPQRIEVDDSRVQPFMNMAGNKMPKGMSSYIQSRDEMMCMEVIHDAIKDWLSYVPVGMEYDESSWAAPIEGALWEMIDCLHEEQSKLNDTIEALRADKKTLSERVEEQDSSLAALSVILPVVRTNTRVMAYASAGMADAFAEIARRELTQEEQEVFDVIKRAVDEQAAMMDNAVEGELSRDVMPDWMHPLFDRAEAYLAAKSA